MSYFWARQLGVGCFLQDLSVCWRMERIQWRTQTLEDDETTIWKKPGSLNNCIKQSSLLPELDCEISKK